MRICYFFTKPFPLAAKKLPFRSEFIYTGTELTGYWKAISQRWGSESLMMVEQDIVIHDSVIPEFEACEEPWCVFPYYAGPMIGNWGSTKPLSSIQLLNFGLGCTKFSAEAQQQVTTADIEASTLPCSECPICWTHIDGPVRRAMQAKGFSPHVHSPAVDHLHYLSIGE